MPPVPIIKDQEDDLNPELESAMPVEEDQPGIQDDELDLGVQVSRQQVDPPNQEPPSRTVPDSSRGEKSYVTVRGAKVTGPGGRGGISRRGECQHQRGGYCLLHGGGAKKLTRWVNKTTSGPGGEKIQKASKQTYYVCDNNKNNTAGSLRQTQLSFNNTRRTTKPVEEDTRGGENFSMNFSSSTEGQLDDTVVSNLPGSGR